MGERQGEGEEDEEDEEKEEVEEKRGGKEEGRRQSGLKRKVMSGRQIKRGMGEETLCNTYVAEENMVHNFLSVCST